MRRRKVSELLAELRAVPGVYHVYVTGGKGGYDIIFDDGREVWAPTYRAALKTVTPVTDSTVKAG